RTSYRGNTSNFWPANAADRLAALQLDLSDKTDKAGVEAATADLWLNFRLTPEMLARLATLRDKHDAWLYDGTRNPSLEADEWDEVYNLLAQAQKYALYSVWLTEESTRNLVFGPKSFWISLREPKEGA